MRKIIFICIFCCLASFHVVAQLDHAKINFGAKIGLDYSLLGVKTDYYAGGVGPNLGMFFSYQSKPRLGFVFESMYSGVNFRQQQNDTKYEGHYLDVTGYGYFYPSSQNNDIALVFGVRPSMLLAHSTNELQFGSYNTVSDPANRNKNGNIDLGLVLGVSVKFSPIINLELNYTYSVTDQNNNVQIQGRPSTIELGLRIHAINFKEVVEQKQKNTKQQIQQFKNGTLLVMLLTPNKSEMEEFMRLGGESKTKLVEAELKTRNKMVMEAFKSSFNICPVYFYYDTSALLVKEGHLEGILLNDNLQPDPSIHLQKSLDEIYIASFNDDHSEYTDKRNYGLYIYDANMNQLPKPFNRPKNLASPAHEFDYLKSKDDGIKVHTYMYVPFNEIISNFNSTLLKEIQ